MRNQRTKFLAGLGLVLCSAAALAVLPPLSDAQKQAAAEKKVVSDAAAEKAKQAMLAKMDELTTRWRSNAASLGVPALPAVPIAAPTAALTAPTTQAITPPQVNNPAQPANPVKP